jgi:hypothetical protein
MAQPKAAPTTGARLGQKARRRPKSKPLKFEEALSPLDCGPECALLERTEFDAVFIALRVAGEAF